MTPADKGVFGSPPSTGLVLSRPQRVGPTRCAKPATGPDNREVTPRLNHCTNPQVLVEGSGHGGWLAPTHARDEVVGPHTRFIRRSIRPCDGHNTPRTGRRANTATRDPALRIDTYSCLPLGSSRFEAARPNARFVRGGLPYCPGTPRQRRFRLHGRLRSILPLA